MASVTEEIRQWLEKGGRPLEMQVAAAFMNSDADVQQSPWFKDSESEKPREIDVVAIYRGDLRPYVMTVEVECKAHNDPFVVLVSDPGDPLEARCLSHHARDVMPAKNDGVVIDLNSTPVFDPSVPVGHAILTKATKRDGSDKGWAAAMSAAKAAHWFATRFDNDEHPECHLALPVVVCDEVLAVAEVVGGQTRVREVDHARFVLKWPLGEATSVIVDVVRPPALDGFVRGCVDASRIILSHFQTASGQG